MPPSTHPLSDPASIQPPARCRPWLAALSGAFMTVILAFCAVGIGVFIGGTLGGVISYALFFLAIAACAPGLLICFLWLALSAPIEGPLDSPLHHIHHMHGVLIVGIGSLLFWACVGGALGYWRCVRQQQ